MARNYEKAPMTWEPVTIPESAAGLVKAWAAAKTEQDRARDELVRACGFAPEMVNVSTMRIGQGVLTLALKVNATKPAADPTKSTLGAARIGGSTAPNTPSRPSADPGVSKVDQWADWLSNGMKAPEDCPEIMRAAVAKRLGFDPWVAKAGRKPRATKGSKPAAE